MRAGGYAVDMVIFAAIAMLMLVLAGFILLASSDWATQDVSDAQLYLFLGMNGIGLPVIWSVLNIALLAARDQTGGQYVAGVQLGREDGTTANLRDKIVWWFCFNPLFFSWPMAAAAGLPVSIFIIVGWAELMLVIWGLLFTLCIACPIIALVSAAIDSANRALHDRIVGLVAVPAE